VPLPILAEEVQIFYWETVMIKLGFTLSVTVENACIYTLPAEPPPIYVAASVTESVRAAGELGDGRVSTTPDKEIVEGFAKAGGGSKP
jgi:hypothetical protein